MHGQIIESAVVAMNDTTPVEGKVVQLFLLVSILRPAQDEILRQESEKGGAGCRVRRSFEGAAPNVALPIWRSLGSVMAKAAEKGESLMKRSFRVATASRDGL
jgi:hypothetical protein